MTWAYKKYKEQEFTDFILWLISMYQPDRYLEVGLQKGVNFNKIAPKVKEAYGVDSIIQPSVTKAGGARLFGMTSQAFAAHWKEKQGGFFDLMFIDGDHEKEAVQGSIGHVLIQVKSKGPCKGHRTRRLLQVLIGFGHAHLAHRLMNHGL